MPNLARATARSDAGDLGRYALDLDGDWSANGHCTAGYLAGVLTRAVLQDPREPFPAVTAVDVRYLRVAPPAPATVEVTPLRTGAGGAHWQAMLHVGAHLCVAALVTSGKSSASAGRVPPPDLPSLDSCVLLPTRAPGFDVPVMGVLAQYADPDGLSWLTGKPSGQGLAQGWVRAADGSPPDVLTLLAAFDSMPTATFDLGLQGWAATVDLSIHVLGLPEPGPLRLHRRVHETAGDLVSLRCDIWDVDSALVATGVQLCTLRR